MSINEILNSNFFKENILDIEKENKEPAVALMYFIIMIAVFSLAQL